MADHRHDEDAEDWDAELEKTKPSTATSLGDLAASKSMVTITPAGHRFNKKQPVEVRVDWVYPGDTVELFLSYDDFATPVVLEPVVDENGEEFHSAILLVPPGHYLARYRVDGEWLIDDNQEVVYSLGNEYNALIVRDPDAPDDEDGDDDDDWDDIDEGLPEDFQVGADAAKELLNAIPASASGMVTISPAAAAAGAAVPEVPHQRDHRALQWDPHVAAFKVAERHDETEAESDAALTGSDSQADVRKAKEKARRRAKKKRNRDKRKQTGVPGRTARGDINAIKSEVMKREAEWREAWILHELKVSEAREKEKSQLRQQWKEEREQWINKIKVYSQEATTLRTQLNELQTRLEVAESSKGLTENASQRKLDSLEQQTSFLTAEAEKAKKEAAESNNQVRKLRSENDQLRAQVQASENEKSKVAAELQSKEAHSRIALEAAHKEVTETKAALTAKLETLKKEYEAKLSDQANSAAVSTKARADFDKQVAEITAGLNSKWTAELKTAEDSRTKLSHDLQAVTAQLAAAKDENAKADAEMKKRRAEFDTELSRVREELRVQTQNLAKDSASVQSGLNQRITTLTSEVQAKEKALNAATDELKAVHKQLTEASLSRDSLQKQLATEVSALQAKVTAFEAKALAAETDAQASKSNLSKRVDELTAQLADKSKELQRVLAETETANSTLAEAKRNVATLTASLDTAKSDLTAAKTASQQSSEQIKTLTARIESLNKERATLESEQDKKNAEAEANITKLRGDLLSTQQKLDGLKGQLDQLTSDLKIKEANFQREKAALEREAEAARKGKDALLTRLNTVVATAKALRAGLDGFKEQNIRETGTIKAELEDNKKIVVDALNAQADLLAATMRKYKKELSERRKYFNLVQELRGNIRVFCRARPILAKDEAKGTKVACSFEEENTIAIKTDKRQSEFEFDRVFSGGDTNDAIFKEIRNLVESCMDGYNVCIFAYGQTGSGKTHTMSGTSEDPGVNFRALTELFKIREERRDDFRYKITVSMLEIYNETVRDLLDKTMDKPMKIHKGPQGMFVENQAEWDVETQDDVIKAMDTGSKNRSTGVTNMNEHSSRSHSLVSVKVVGQHRTAGIQYYGKLHLIDLAGSERISKSQATGQRLKEAQAINKSLSALGNVIEALQHKTNHVPYRDSKLTFLLQDSLGGHAKTLMFINVSPTEDDSEETFCSLNFASRVRRVELGGAVRNVGGGGPGAAVAAPAAGPSDTGDFVSFEPTADTAQDDDLVDDTAGTAPASAGAEDKKSAAAVKRPSASPTPGSAPAKPAVATKPVTAAPGVRKAVAPASVTPVKKPAATPVKK